MKIIIAESHRLCFIFKKILTNALEISELMSKWESSKKKFRSPYVRTKISFFKQKINFRFFFYYLVYIRQHI